MFCPWSENGVKKKLVDNCPHFTYSISVKGADRTVSQPGEALGRCAGTSMMRKLPWKGSNVHLQVMPRNRVEGEFRCQLKQQSAVILHVELC